MILAEEILPWIIYLLIGAFAGLMAGVLGVGGGIIVVPGLVFVFQLTAIIPQKVIMHVAAGTSLAVMVVTSLASLRAHFKLGEILWSVFNKLWPGIVIGALVGATIAGWIPTAWLKIIFALFLFVVALKMVTTVHMSKAPQVPSIWVNRLISFLIGLKSALLGIGGGVLIIPYLTYCGVPVRQIAAVVNLCTLSIGFIGALIFMLTGHYEMKAIPYALGYVYWPAVLGVAVASSVTAPLGAQLNYLLPVIQLKYGFIVILLLTAINLLF